MIDAFIRGLLGSAGSALLDLYIANSVWINLLIFLYVLLVLLGKGTYTSMKQEILRQLAAGYPEGLDQKSSAWFEKALLSKPLDLAKVSQGAKLPWVTPPKKYYFRLKSPKAIQELFTPEVIRSWFQPESSAVTTRKAGE